MCLYAYNTKPLVCSKDLIVYKKLKKTDLGKTITPFMNVPVEYGKTMVAKGEMPEFPTNTITSGVIHSYITLHESVLHEAHRETSNVLYAKATIKAGTPFFVSLDVSEIASKELFIHDRKINMGKSVYSILSDLEKTRKEIYKIMRRQCVGENGVRVGDVLLSDKTFIVPSKITGKTKAIGIVAFIRPDGAPQVISLNIRHAMWSADLKCAPLWRVPLEHSAFNGMEYTKELYKTHSSDLHNYPALKYCVEYKTDGTKEGDWYLPSADEMTQAARNSFIINETAKKLATQGAELMEFYFRYWTSEETSWSKALACDCGDASVIPNLKNIRCFVLPFLNF